MSMVEVYIKGFALVSQRWAWRLQGGDAAPEETERQRETKEGRGEESHQEKMSCNISTRELCCCCFVFFLWRQTLDCAHYHSGRMLILKEFHWSGQDCPVALAIIREHTRRWEEACGHVSSRFVCCSYVVPHVNSGTNGSWCYLLQNDAK